MPSSAILDKNEKGESSKITKRLRVLFLTPLTITFVTVTFLLIQSMNVYEKIHLGVELNHIDKSVQQFYTENIQKDTNAILAVIDGLEYNPSISIPFVKSNRKVLYNHSKTIYNRLLKQLDITHFYFFNKDGRVLLRMHAPQRFDDVIKRATLLTAMRTKAVSHGIELGPLGTLTLRVVKPWYKGDGSSQKLIGYIELGTEVDQILKRMSRSYQSQVLVLINKKYLHKKQWQSGMKALGRPLGWDRFSSVVLASPISKKIPAVIEQCLTDSSFEKLCDHSKQLEHDGKYRALSVPIRDAKGEIVAKVLVVVDISPQLITASWAIRIVWVISALGCIFLFGLFYYLIGKVGKRLENDERELLSYANFDGLTKLYNHRIFYHFLGNEVSRAKRYKNQLALFMIDIDHFKHVNDTYGHQVGDVVLEELSRLICDKVRKPDIVCRYGGEEITIILPETSKREALQLAERLRSCVELFAFNSSSGQPVNITISIGVSFFSELNDTVASLVSVADTALYKAKNKGRNCVCC